MPQKPNLSQAQNNFLTSGFEISIDMMSTQCSQYPLVLPRQPYRPLVRDQVGDHRAIDELDVHKV